MDLLPKDSVDTGENRRGARPAAPLDKRRGYGESARRGTLPFSTFSTSSPSCKLRLPVAMSSPPPKKPSTRPGRVPPRIELPNVGWWTILSKIPSTCWRYRRLIARLPLLVPGLLWSLIPLELKVLGKMLLEYGWFIVQLVTLLLPWLLWQWIPSLSGVLRSIAARRAEAEARVVRLYLM